VLADPAATNLAAKAKPRMTKPVRRTLARGRGKNPAHAGKS
jgi:hypothetical protein